MSKIPSFFEVTILKKKKTLKYALDRPTTMPWAVWNEWLTIIYIFFFGYRIFTLKTLYGHFGYFNKKKKYEIKTD